MLPIEILSELGKIGGYAVFLLIGIGFGVALELAGFGDSRRLAAQFYFKDMTVLKTMFTGIIVAAILIFLSAAIGILDFSQIIVNKTFLWPGIVGGLIMGVGFIVGGYCPGTSVVAASSFKIDGLTFLVGAIIGTGLFGETVPFFDEFWNSSYTERLLVSDWLGWSIGATVFAIVIMALVMFYGAEKVEEFFKFKGSGKKVSWKITKKAYKIGAAALFTMALLVWIIGQPDLDRKWEIMESKYGPQLDSKEVVVSPLEYVKTYNDASLRLVTLDLRSPKAFNEFKIKGSKNANLENLRDAEYVKHLASLPANGLVILIADDYAVAEQAWKYLKVQNVINVYIMENGLKDYNELFADKTIHGEEIDLASPPAELLHLFPEDAYISKIKIVTKKRAGGLCG